MTIFVLVILICLGGIAACGSDHSALDHQETGQQNADATTIALADSAAAPSDTTGLHTLQSETIQKLNLDHTWRGDFEGMVERRLIRVLVTPSLTQYFLDGPVQRGITYEAMKIFDDWLNKDLGTRTLRIHVVLIPIPRDQLLPALVEGIGDIAAANLTITPARREMVDFSDPFMKNAKEIVVTGPGAPPLNDLESLAGQTIFVRRSSSYYESLLALNETFRQAGQAPTTLATVDEHLEDEDLLEMVNAGLIPITIVDDHKAGLWSEVFENITPHPELAVRSGGQIGWAFRKSSPQLAKVVNRFVKEHKQGTLLFNVITKRYLQNTKWARNVLDEKGRARFEATAILFQKYAEQYGFDWLMMIAQGYQESGLDQKVKSHAGAIGIMQMLPSTAASKEVGITDINNAENNIHAGTKYMHWLRNRHFAEDDLDPQNQTLFVLASYNSGATRIKRLRREAAARGLDPNLWFQNVEVIAAEKIGRETVQYVSNIYKYYVAYKLIMEQEIKKTQITSENDNRY